MLEAVIFRKYT